MKFEWEKIHENYCIKVGGSNTHRAKVFGGWIVSYDLYTDVLHKGNERTMATSMVFVPDSEHSWVID